MKAGVLRHRVDIEDNVPVQNAGTGDPEDNWVSVATNVPAEIAPLSAKEFVAGLALVAQVTARIRIRWRAGIKPTMRFKHYTNASDDSPRTFDLYNIAGVLPDPKYGREYLTFPVMRGVNKG